jgi:hypothetical protein
MADSEPAFNNSQMTDPMAAENQPYPSVIPAKGFPPAEAVLPPNVDDPGESDVPAGTPLARGFQSSDV